MVKHFINLITFQTVQHRALYSRLCCSLNGKEIHPTKKKERICVYVQLAAAQSTRLRRRRNGQRSYPASEVRGGEERSYPGSEVRGGGQEEIPHAPSPRPGAMGGWSNPTPEARGGGRGNQPHVQGAVAARVQESLEELSHIEGQEGRQ